LTLENLLDTGRWMSQAMHKMLIHYSTELWSHWDADAAETTKDVDSMMAVVVVVVVVLVLVIVGYPIGPNQFSTWHFLPTNQSTRDPCIRLCFPTAILHWSIRNSGQSVNPAVPCDHEGQRRCWFYSICIRWRVTFDL